MCKFVCCPLAFASSVVYVPSRYLQVHTALLHIDMSKLLSALCKRNVWCAQYRVGLKGVFLWRVGVNKYIDSNSIYMPICLWIVSKWLHLWSNFDLPIVCKIYDIIWKIFISIKKMMKYEKLRLHSFTAYRLI